MDAEDGRDLEMKVGGMVEVEGRGGEGSRPTLFHSVTNDGGRSEPFHR